MRRTRLEAPQRVRVDRIASPPKPVHPGADVRLKVLAAAGRTRLAPDLADDAAHGLTAGQEHGIDDRGQGLRRARRGHNLRPFRAVTIGASPRLEGGLPIARQGIARRTRDPVVGSKAL